MNGINKYNLTEDEIRTFQKLILSIPFYLIKENQTKADTTRIIPLLKEVLAGKTFIHKAPSLYPENELIKLSFDLKQALSPDENNTPNLKISVTIDEVINLIGETKNILKSKVPHREQQEFYQSVYRLALEISTASGDYFFGTGKKINTIEAEFLNTLKNELLS